MSSHLALRDGVRDEKRPHDLLPLYNWIVLGMSEEGKTSLMTTLFVVDAPAEVLLSYYHKIYFVNAKAHPDALQPPYDILSERNVNNQFVFLPNIEEREWTGIKEEARRSTKMSLLVLDDKTGDEELMTHIGGASNGKGPPGIITTASHAPPAGFRIHIWTFAHAWETDIPRGIRNQAKALAVAKVTAIPPAHTKLTPCSVCCIQRAFTLYSYDLIDDCKSAFIHIDGVSKPDIKAACKKAFTVNTRDFLYVTKERKVS